MNAYSLALSSALLTGLYVVILRREWKALYAFVRGGMLLIFVFTLLLLATAKMFDYSIALTLARLLIYGVISAILLLPAIVDSAIILLPRGNGITTLLESFVLLRNVASGAANDFLIGVLTAPSRTGLHERLRHISLSVEAIIARTPDLATNFGIATLITNFDVHDLQFIQPPAAKLILALSFYTLYFGYFLVI